MKKINIRNVNKKQLFFIGVGICMLILIAAGISFYKNRKVTIDLNDYITVEYKGYDTVGTAVAYWDMDTLKEDYGDKIRINEKEVEKYNEDHKRISDNNPFQSMIDLCVVGGLDKNSDLTNGENINYIWYCDVELAEKLFYCKLKCEDKEYTVEGLEEVGQIDPFENLSVTYDGISPVGKVKCNSISTNGAYGNISYTVTYPQDDEEENVKNGDEITITAKVKNTKEFIKEYGVELSTTQKTYTVEGLPEYVTSEGDLTEDVLARLQSAMADDLRESVEENVQRNDRSSSHITGSITSIDYVGNYLLTAKEIQEYYVKNYCDLFYQVVVHEELQLKTGETKSYDITYYRVVRIQNLVVDSSGNCTYEDGYVRGGNVYEYKTDVKQGIFGTPVIFRYDGYESATEYYDEAMVDYLDLFNIETTIQ